MNSRFEVDFKEDLFEWTLSEAEHSGQEVREEVWVIPLHHSRPADIFCV